MARKAVTLAGGTHRHITALAQNPPFVVMKYKFASGALTTPPGPR